MIDLVISNVVGAEQLSRTVPEACEVVLHAICIWAPDTHANLLEGNFVEGVILGILFFFHWRLCVEQLTVGPQRGGEAELVCLADLQHQLPFGSRASKQVRSIVSELEAPYARRQGGEQQEPSHCLSCSWRPCKRVQFM